MLGGPEHRDAHRRRRGDVRDRRRRVALRVPRALRLLDVGRRRLLPAARRDVGDARRRPSGAEGGRRPRARRGRRAADRPNGGRRPGEARRRPADARRAVERPFRRALRRPADERSRRRSPRSPGTRRTRCRSRSASRWRSARSSSSPRPGATSSSPTTAARSPHEPLGAVPGSGAHRGGDGTVRSRARATRRSRSRSASGPALASAPVTHARAAPTREVAEGPIDRRRSPRDLVSLTFSPSCTTGSRSAASSSAPGPPWSAAATTSGRSATASPSRCCDSTPGRSPRSRARRPRRRRAPPTRARPGPPSRSKGRCSASRSRGRRSSTCSAAAATQRSSWSRWSTTAPRRLRFGDGVHGRRPETGTEFEATYRVGNGTAGNIGAGAIAHVATLGGRDRPRHEPAPGGRRRRPGAGRGDPARRARGLPRSSSAPSRRPTTPR